MFIMGYLKFTLTFLFELIRTNIVKTIFIIGAITTFMFAGTFKDDVDSYDVAGVVKVDNNYVYVCRTIHDNKIKYENVWDVKEIPIKDGKISVSSYSFANGFLWVIFSILIILLIVSTIIGRNDDDIGWELEDAWKEAFSTLIYCEEENGYFYYFALGRLISKTNRQVSRSYKITNELHIDGFRDLYRCPKYQTKTQRRETLLNKIGIN
jgi:hypothetical protein